MALDQLDDILSQWSKDYGQQLLYMKQQVGACAPYVPHSFWISTGNPTTPSTGTSPTNGKANGRVVLGGESPSPGGSLYTLPTGGRIMQLLGFNTALSGSGSLNGHCILGDRIADCNLNVNEATGTITGMDATSRLAPIGTLGDGGMLFGEVTTQFGAGIDIFNVSYTNSLGVSGRTTPNISTVASAVVHRSINNELWFPLQDGDTGVRSVQGINSVDGTGTSTGKWDLSIVRVFETIPSSSAGMLVGRDMVTNNPSKPRVWDNTAFTMYVIPSVATTLNTTGEIWICEG